MKLTFSPASPFARKVRIAAIELGLDVARSERQPGRAAIDHAADGGTVGFAEGRGTEQGPESRCHRSVGGEVARHGDRRVLACLDRLVRASLALLMAARSLLLVVLWMLAVDFTGRV